jgi:hypothetical protein
MEGEDNKVETTNENAGGGSVENGGTTSEANTTEVTQEEAKTEVTEEQDPKEETAAKTEGDEQAS